MKGDSQVLNAFLYAGDSETLVPVQDIVAVRFTVLVPGDDPAAPTLDAIDGNIVADGHGQYQVDPWINSLQGQYKSFAQFEFQDGDLVGLNRSVVTDYDVFDPFVRAKTSPADAAIDQCWMKIEDCFDSEIGGPWLRDMTLAVFDKTKINGFIPEALMDINQQMPMTDYNETTFPYGGTDSLAIMAQGLLVATLRHLMRSYTEQPDVMNSPVGFMDRKRYQQAWKAQYDVELAQWQKWLNRWKLRSYDLSSSALLLSNKAGRNLGAPFRSRNAGRGYG
jgi:hypothetical protein